MGPLSMVQMNAKDGRNDCTTCKRIQLTMAGGRHDREGSNDLSLTSSMMRAASSSADLIAPSMVPIHS